MKNYFEMTDQKEQEEFFNYMASVLSKYRFTSLDN